MSNRAIVGYVTPIPLRTVVIVAMVFGFASLVQASQITVFTDRQTWENASHNVKDVSFDGLGGTPGTQRYEKAYPSGLAIDGITFTGDGNYLYARSSIAASFLYGPPAEPVCFGGCVTPPSGSGIDVMLYAAVTSVGWDFSNFYQSGAYGQFYRNGLTVQFGDGTSYTYTELSVLAATSVFVGFTSTEPILSFKVLAGGFPTIANFSTGSLGGPMPEPRSLVSMSLAVASLIGTRLRSRLRAPHPRP